MRPPLPPLTPLKILKARPLRGVPENELNELFSPKRVSPERPGGRIPEIISDEPGRKLESRSNQEARSKLPPLSISPVQDFANALANQPTPTEISSSRRVERFQISQRNLFLMLICGTYVLHVLLFIYVIVLVFGGYLFTSGQQLSVHGTVAVNRNGLVGINTASPAAWLEVLQTLSLSRL